MSDPKNAFDRRQHRRQSERNFIIAVILMLIIGGSVVIGLVYGWPSVLTGWLCLLPGAGALLLIWLVLHIMERIVQEE